MRSCLKIIFFLFPLILFSQQDKSYSVYLIGDAGEDTVTGKALIMLQGELLKDSASTVIFLGDNVYPDGFIKNKRTSELKMLSQLNMLNKYKGRAYFIPGNHDWAAQKRRGMKRVLDQKEYIENYTRNNTEILNKHEAVFLPARGLPGPESIMLDPKLRLIIIDTQWFLHFYKKNKINSIKETEEVFYRNLDSLLQYSKANNEKVIIAAHHPLFTNGIHSRKLQPLRFCINYTPFQIFGQCGLNRLFSQDLSQPRYAKVRKRVLKSLEKYDHITYVSGHDHNIQFFKEKGNRFIVSGCGSKTEHLKSKKRFTSFFEDDSKTGFVKLECFPDKVITTIYRVGEEPEILKNY